MNILVIGGGGREHALVWSISKSSHCHKLYCAPGNPGIAQIAQCVNLEFCDGFKDVISFCKRESIDLVVVGPERPLAEGIADVLWEAGIKTFGPKREGAKLESSKRFAKELMLEAAIPTAQATSHCDLSSALEELERRQAPYVIKAEGLAEGKGVTVAHSLAEAQTAVRACLEQGIFGGAGAEILIEDYLEGEEISLLAFVDGETVLAMDSAQDHKAVFDGDCGPNTGGMGAYSPAPALTADLKRECEARILKPCLEALLRRGIHYCGVMYAGLMLTADGPKVIEFNCRFGDPETQVLLPRLKTDFVEVMLACVEGRLKSIKLEWTNNAAVCVVAASCGYPGDYQKGCVIKGLSSVNETQGAIFYAGVGQNTHGEVITSGGRVLGITAWDPDLRCAIDHAYKMVAQVHFDGMYFRKDIGQKALHYK